jgi:hypothetical protein
MQRVEMKIRKEVPSPLWGGLGWGSLRPVYCGCIPAFKFRATPTPTLPTRGRGKKFGVLILTALCATLQSRFMKLYFPMHMSVRMGTAMITKTIGRLLIGVAFLSIVAIPTSTESYASSKFRKVHLNMPKTLKEVFGTTLYNNIGPGYGCHGSEVVQTCDAHTSMSMPEEGFWGSKLKLGSAANSAVLGIKVKTTCIAHMVRDSRGTPGCAYEGCVGYDKPITMVCKQKDVD